MVNVLRNTTMRVNFEINSQPLEQANRAIDEATSNTRSWTSTVSEAQRMSHRFSDGTDQQTRSTRNNTQETQRNTDETRRNSDTRSRSASGLSDYQRQLQLVSSEMRASTAGLSEMGRSEEALRLRTQGLTRMIEIQQQQVAHVTSRLEAMRSASNHSTTATHNLTVELNHEIARLGDLRGALASTNHSIDNFSRSTNDVYQGFGDRIRNSKDELRDIGQGALVAGGAIGSGLALGVKAGADFESQMSAVKSVMSPDEVQKYSKALQDLAIKEGASTKYSAIEAAQGEEELVKAGVSVKDIVGGGLVGALNLATAGGLELKDAAEVASTALNAFRDDNISVTKAADLLAGAANASATDVGELKFGLSSVSAVASGVGLSFRDTNTSLAAFAQNGLTFSPVARKLAT